MWKQVDQRGWAGLAVDLDRAVCHPHFVRSFWVGAWLGPLNNYFSHYRKEVRYLDVRLV